MSLRHRLAPLFFLASLSLGACTAAGRPTADAGTTPTPAPIVTPEPRPEPAIDRAALRSALAERRAASVERFLAYREARVYPRNLDRPAGTHLWVDAAGNLCAAATIIAGDWGRDATARVALENNFIALADVHDGPLADWILTSGLTHHEVVAIQVPAPDGSREFMRPEPDPEIVRLYQIYVDVERQLAALSDESLEQATDALMRRPDLARALLSGVAAGPGRFAVEREPIAGRGFAQPPPA